MANEVKKQFVVIREDGEEVYRTSTDWGCEVWLDKEFAKGGRFTGWEYHIRAVYNDGSRQTNETDDRL